MMYLLTMAVLAGSLGQIAGGQSERKDEAASKRLAFMRQSMARCQIQTGSSETGRFRFEEEPLLRWSNPVSGVVDGTLFVWTVDGRPEVVAKCFINQTQKAWCEAIQSLCAGSFVMRQEGLTDRVHIVGGDYEHEALPPGPDVVLWSGNLRHRLRHPLFGGIEVDNLATW